ncbi:hypothetical protein ASG87_16810 [Frateuria sp. Soil773]|uniref:condensation domain-containing protein n=1 Tax=Frateuria sp. Soil773 TaxID=1736407 RepID=UPI0006F80754|nr:condensation domain-containing protein [Frateuria sp. Soil773]KRE95918.1 hypothetical protein ASG87_16810 [Frateuria sp. Soil773]
MNAVVRDYSSLCLEEKRERLLAAMLRQGIDAPESILMPPSQEQLRMWFATRMQGAAGAYNLCNAIPVPDGVPVTFLRRCFEYLVCRHGILRSRFVERDGMPWLQTLPFEQCGFQVSEEPAGERSHQDCVAAVMAVERGHAFDLASECLVRIRWLADAAGGGTLVVNVHHIVTDTWSLAQFAAEFGKVFEAFAEGHEPELSPLDAGYRDYGLWQKHWLRGIEAQAQLNYWRQHLHGIRPLNLPQSSPRPSEKVWFGATVPVDLPKTVVARLDGVQRDMGVTRFALLCAAVSLALRAMGGPEDVVLGSSVSTRREPLLEPVFGLFLNQVAMRFQMGANPSVREYLVQSARVTRDALNHSDLPFGEVVAALSPDRDPSRSPLFDALVSLQNTPRSALQGSAGQFAPAWGQDPAKFDLSFFFEEEGGQLIGRLVYASKLFSAQTGQAIVTALATILAAIPDGGEQTLVQFLSSIEGRVTMNTTQVEGGNVSRFKRGERKAVDLTALRPVEESIMPAGFPYLYQAREAGLDALGWIRGQQLQVAERRREHGAVLLRGFKLAEVGMFERVVQLTCDHVIAGYGDLPEEKGTDRVYGSTPYPNNRRILFHSESSHMANWPLHQFFACVVASETGGETPIVDVRKIYDQLDPMVRDRFARLGLTYVRHFIPGLDVPWHAFFKTHDRAEVEAICARSGATCQWKHDDILMVRQPSQAVAQHPVTGRWSFFNQIMLHHPYFLYEEEREALISLYGAENLPRMVTYGDGSEIGEDILADLLALYERNEVAFTWQAGDLLMLDNMSIAHARNPFSGARKIIVGMGDPVDARA